MKINIGCGASWAADGWVGIDQAATAGVWERSGSRFVDIDVKNGLPFDTDTVDVVFSSHALEHFTLEEATLLLFEMYRVLKAEAPLCLVVPDMDLYIRKYIERDAVFLSTPEIIGGRPRGNMADNFLMNFYSDPMFNNTCHKYAYNLENLSSLLSQVGFDEVERVDFHDFSYWPELRKNTFRSPIKHVEKFSLCVQCRKKQFNPDYRHSKIYQEAEKFALVMKKEHDLAQRLSTLLVLHDGLSAERDALRVGNETLAAERDGLLADRKALSAERDVLSAAKETLSTERDALSAEKDELRQELSARNDEVQELEAQMKRVRDKEERLALEFESKAQEILGTRMELEAVQAVSIKRQLQLESNIGLLRAFGRNVAGTWTRPRERLVEIAANVRYGRKQAGYSVVSRSNIFDRRWYLEQNPDIAKAGVDPILHYLRHGWLEGRDPNAFFNTRWYLSSYPDVAAARMNPLVHFLLHGAGEGRSPGPKFNAGIFAPYQRAGGDVRRNPLYGFMRREAAAQQASLLYSPVISFVMPVYNTSPRHLKEVTQSILNQTYPRWELCAVDDGSTNVETRKVLEELSLQDSRVRVTFEPVNGGIARASQRALETARGEFVAFVDHDDALATNALEEIVNLLRAEPQLDYIYTDHAVIDDESRVRGYALKPDWSPEFFLATNYIVHLKVVRSSAVRRVGGFKGLSSVIQDVGLTCRLVEAGVRIRHLPKVLYYWREHPKSVAAGTTAKPEIEKLAIKTYEEHLARQGVPARVVWPRFFRQRSIGAYKLEFASAQSTSVAIIAVLSGIRPASAGFGRLISRTEFEPRPQVHYVQAPWSLPDSEQPQAHPIPDDAALLRFVESLDSDIVVFMRSGARLVSTQWLKELIGYFSVHPEIGAVGGKVLDRKLNIRGGGIVLTNGGRVICGGASDNSDGHWFNGRLASNVEAVSVQLLATRRKACLAAGGLPLVEFGDSAGIPYGLRLRSAGYRIVFNPWAKIVDDEPAREAPGLKKALARQFGAGAQQDRYYNPGFDPASLYVMKQVVR